MASKINFKKFKKGDNVVINLLDKEKTLSGVITNISYNQKIVFLENDGSDYECEFSEIKKIAFDVNFDDFNQGDNVVIIVTNKGKEETLTGKIIDISRPKKTIVVESGGEGYECSFSEIKKITLNLSSENPIRTFAISWGIAIALILSLILITYVNEEIHKKDSVETPKVVEKRNTMDASYEATVHKKLVEFCMKNDFDNPTLRKKYNRREFCECTTKLSMSATNSQRNLDPYVVTAMATVSCLKILDGEVSYSEGKRIFLNSLH